MSRYKNHAFTARCRYALRGLAHALSTERSMQVQLVCAVLVLASLLVLRPRAVWWALISGSCALVFACELMNTAIESLADAVHPGDSAAIGRVKDCAAGAVLIACLGALGVGLAFALHLIAAPGGRIVDF